MARYMLSVHSSGEPGPKMSDEEMQRFMQRIDTLEQEMNSSDTLVMSARLHPPDTATVVRFSGTETLTTDGPFVESKEHLGGFYIIAAPDLDAALGWAAKVTAAVGAPIEVRPLWDHPGN